MEGQAPWQKGSTATPKANQAGEKPSLASRIENIENATENHDNYTAHQALMNDHYVWHLNAACEPEFGPDRMDIDGAEIVGLHTDPMATCKVPVLNMSIAKNNHFYHDSGANRHIAHDKSIFTEYMPVRPISVSAFGDKLGTHAIGIGSIKLIGKHGNKECKITLRNVLHIPTARSNLVSQLQLDRAGVQASLSGGRIVLEKNGSPIVDGWVHMDMYRLNMIPLDPSGEVEELQNHVANLKVSPGFYTASWATQVE